MSKASFIRNTRAMTKGSRNILLVLILVGSVFGGAYAYGQGLFTPDSTPDTNNWWDTNPTTSPTTAPSGSWSGQLYLSIVDKVTGASFTTSAVTVNQVVADANGNFNFISGSHKTTTQSANPQAEGKIISEGQQVIVMGSCTGNPSNGLDYYPVWYYFVAGDGNVIYELDDESCFVQTGSDPYTYRIDVSKATPTDERCNAYEASNIKYWFLGDLGLYPRQAAADFDMYLVHGATTLASVTDASTWVDTAAEITANATLTSATNDKLTFTMVGANANLGWGKQFFGISSSGEIQKYGAVLVVTTGILSMEKPSGWNVFDVQTLTDEVAFYKVVEPAFPQNGMKPQWSVDVPMSVNSDATAYKFSMWAIDCQNLGTVGSTGTTTSMPQGYGFVDSSTDYGVGAAVQAVGLTVSSGASATPQLMAYITTPS